MTNSPFHIFAAETIKDLQSSLEELTAIPQEPRNQRKGETGYGW